MKNYTLEEYKEELKLSEDFLEEICLDSEAFNNKNNKYTITISYTIPENLLIAIKNAVENKIIELKEAIDYYNRHASWLKDDRIFGFICGNCGRFSPHKTNFCSSCGFKMDMKFANDKAKEVYEKILNGKMLKNQIKE